MIAAKSVGFQTGPITIEIRNMGGYLGGAEIVLPRPLLTMEGVAAYLMDRVTVLLAGPMAESLTDKKVDKTATASRLRTEEGANDAAKARELLNLLRNIRFPDAATAEAQQIGLTQLDEFVWQRTIGIVEAEESLIVGMANRLAQMVKYTDTKFTLTTADIDCTAAMAARFPPKVVVRPA